MFALASATTADIIAALEILVLAIPIRKRFEVADEIALLQARVASTANLFQGKKLCLTQEEIVEYKAAAARRRAKTNRKWIQNRYLKDDSLMRSLW